MKEENIKLYEQILDEEEYMLPDQAPLEFFVHHNNLHHHENHRFSDSIEEVYFSYGRTAYMNFSYYRRLLKEDKSFRELCTNELMSQVSKHQVKNVKAYVDYILHHLFAIEDVEQAKFFFEQKKVFNIERTQVESISKDKISIFDEIKNFSIDIEKEIFPERHVNATISRKDQLLIPFLAVMLDQGQAAWQMPDELRKNPFLAFFSYINEHLSSDSQKHLREIEKEFSNSKSFLEHYFSSLPQDHLKKTIQDQVHALPGWAGMIKKLEKEKELTPRKDVSLTFLDYIAMRVILSIVHGPQQSPALVTIFSKSTFTESVIHFFTHFRTDESLAEIISIFSQYSPLKLKRIFHQQMEETHTRKVLNLIAQKKPAAKDPNPKFQLFFCIDDREESVRRHLEENFPDVETFGVAGFFGFDMFYQSYHQVRTRKHCPPAATARFVVREEKKINPSIWAEYSLFSHTSLLRGMLDLFIMTPFNFIQFNWRLIFPRAFQRTRENQINCDKDQIKFLNQTGKHEEITEGYTVPELAARVAGILKSSGLIEKFAPYVLMIGHGSDSFNNPHAAAYRCGACSGGNASPNARLFAIVANMPEVRAELQKNFNIVIPPTTRFIGGYHDTCDDRIELFDLDNSLPREDRKRIFYILKEVSGKNAHERIRRFHQISLGLNESSALREVQKRSNHPGESRPELNHATNSICVVGPRRLTRNFFLDRRSFLVSYEPSIDTQGDILHNILSAVIPVCTGINLEYYFSKVDTENYGSGSKTSHNVVGLIGVMNGIRGDLRPGLVWQMVEYHEPLRVLFIVEAKVEHLLKVMEKSSQIKNLVENEWMHLAAKDAVSGELFIFRKGQFVPYQITDDKVQRSQKSRNAYESKRQSIDYCIVGDEVKK
jgi:uncharacterized protein YbcC (UPF0753/DUF2309 family)